MGIFGIVPLKSLRLKYPLKCPVYADSHKFGSIKGLFAGDAVKLAGIQRRTARRIHRDHEQVMGHTGLCGSDKSSNCSPGSRILPVSADFMSGRLSFLYVSGSVNALSVVRRTIRRGGSHIPFHSCACHCCLRSTRRFGRPFEFCKSSPPGAVKLKITCNAPSW